MGLFRRRPPAPLPEVMADLLDDLARVHVTRPGLLMARLIDLDNACLRLESTDPAWSTAADVEAAGADLVAARQAVLDLSRTARTAVNHGIATSNMPEPRKEGS